MLRSTRLPRRPARMAGVERAAGGNTHVSSDDSLGGLGSLRYCPSLFHCSLASVGAVYQSLGVAEYHSTHGSFARRQPVDMKSFALVEAPGQGQAHDPERAQSRYPDHENQRRGFARDSICGSPSDPLNSSGDTISEPFSPASKISSINIVPLSESKVKSNRLNVRCCLTGWTWASQSASASKRSVRSKGVQSSRMKTRSSVVAMSGRQHITRDGHTITDMNSDARFQVSCDVCSNHSPEVVLNRCRVALRGGAAMRNAVAPEKLLSQQSLSQAMSSRLRRRINTPLLPSSSKI